MRLTFSNERFAEATRAIRAGEPISPSLLNDMFAEARKALELSLKLSPQERTNIISKLDYNALRQEMVLKKLSKGLPEAERKKLSSYLCACSQRCQMIKKVMKSLNMPSIVKTQKTQHKSHGQAECGCKEGHLCKVSKREASSWKRIFPTSTNHHKSEKHPSTP